jgi:hypothetical protein
MIWLVIGGYVALAGYILWQAYLLDQMAKRIKELEPPF